jgi:acetylornithine deacetylase/succinyl-diaminopimelate desuccinylase-like protein
MPTRAEPEVARVHAVLAPARQRLAERDDATLRTQVAISEIAAPTGEESRRAAWIARRLAATGIRDVRTDDAGNVLARRPGTKQVAPVLVCAHLDTVFPRETPLRVRHEGARLSGPGIGDNGRGLAAMLAIAEELDGTRLRTVRPVLFAATTGEEGVGDLRGAKHLFATLSEAPAAAIAIDGAGDERIVHRALGSRRFRVTYRGTGGHSWAAYGLPNPVHAAAGAASRLAELPLPRAPRTTLSVNRVGGGLSINSIPDLAWIEVDLRSTSTELLDRYEREVRQIARIAAQHENARRTPGSAPLALVVDTIGHRPCGETPVDDPLVAQAIAATRLIEREPELTTASTDANIPISLGIPGIAVGAGGRGGDAHTADEWFDNIDGALGIARVLTIVAAAAGLA